MDPTNWRRKGQATDPRFLNARRNQGRRRDGACLDPPLDRTSIKDAIKAFVSLPFRPCVAAPSAVQFLCADEF
eukprot:3255201-Rhodomonas_salina.2